jgi:glycosyltransferase involved in cell wall biosynthesis
MRIAILYSPWCLSFRKTLDLDTWRTDPRGLSGSELCAIRLYQEFEAAGHDVVLYTHSQEHILGGTVRVWEKRGDYDEHDLAISINYPDELREVKAKLRVCYQLVNGVEYCKAGVERFVDLWISPSEAHRDKFLNDPTWHRVEVTHENPTGKAQYVPSASQWEVVPLGCDPERYEGFEKVPGRVVYCSSPDRGLHWLLQEWPAIRKAVPHASLRIFYRLKDWIAHFDTQPFFLPIEGQRNRALYIREALKRLEGHGVEVFDSVNRETIEREMAQAEVLAYPCDTTRWSEGFSCTVLEACAARACPVITDCDALGSIYRDVARVVARGRWPGITWQEAWRTNVIDCLQDSERRSRINARAYEFAKELTWTKTASSILELAQARLSSKSESNTATAQD